MIAVLATVVVALGGAGPCHTHACEERVAAKRRQKVWARKRRIVAPYDAKLMRMAMCESTMNWRIHNGSYSGGLQFVLSTWRSVGGRRMPHQNSRLEQKYRAVLLIQRSGYGQWPICGSR